MLSLIAPIFILLIAPLLMLAMRVLQPKFASIWLVATFAAAIAWPLVLWSRLAIPSDGSGIEFPIPLLNWQPAEFFPVLPTLRLDWISWPLALVLVTLLLAVLLTDIARNLDANRTTQRWTAYAAACLLTAIGLLGVLSANLLTLLLAWAAMDLLELVIFLALGMLDRGDSEKAVIAFATRAAGMLLALWGGLIGQPGSGEGFMFTAILPAAALPLLLSAWIRLGILPFHVEFSSRTPLRPGLGTLLRLAPSASTLMLVVRISQVSELPDYKIWLLAAAAVAALTGAIRWLRAPSALAGRSAWLLAFASLSIAAAIRNQPEAALAWSLALLLPGSLLFLFTPRPPHLLPLAAIGLICITGLPFTPGWWGMLLFSPPISALNLLLLAAHVAVLAGYIRHARRSELPPPGLERWVWLVFPLGLILILVAHLILMVSSLAYARQTGQPWPTLLQSWPAVVALVCLGGAWLVQRRRPQRILPPVKRSAPHSDEVSPEAAAAVAEPGETPLSVLLLQRTQMTNLLTRGYQLLQRFLAFRWLASLIWGLYTLARRVVFFFSMILEGEGGILWTLLLISLLIATLVQSGGGL